MPSQTADLTPAPAASPKTHMTVVVCGEVRSGKSTVLDALARRRLPKPLGACDAADPAVAALRTVVRHRGRPGTALVQRDGRIVELSEDNATDAPDLEAVDHLLIWSDSPHLAGIELVELPLTTAEDLSEDDRAVLRAADAMIWVTIGSQAWRFTEKTILDVLGEDRPAHALLTVSRADKLRRAKDRDKLMDRLVRETGDYFDACHLLNGSGRNLDMSHDSDAAWSTTGAKAIFDVLRRIGGTLGTPPVEDDAAAQPASGAEIVNLDTLRRHGSDRPAKASDGPANRNAAEGKTAVSASPADEGEAIATEIAPAAGTADASRTRRVASGTRPGAGDAVERRPGDAPGSAADEGSSATGATAVKAATANVSAAASGRKTDGDASAEGKARPGRDGDSSADASKASDAPSTGNDTATGPLTGEAEGTGNAALSAEATKTKDSSAPGSKPVAEKKAGPSAASPNAEADAAPESPATGPLVDALRALAGDIRSVEAACLRGPEGMAALAGDPDLCQGLDRQGTDLFARVAEAYRFDGAEGELAAVSVVVSGKRLMLERSGPHTLCVLADTGAMSEGLARATMRRFDEAIAEAS
ncbi:hypothetical protein LVO79_11395 [Roseivivax marinus]|uniref:hypothetical protein n=1 Tax=Roseivivax marinus TaxID=1379903 RepID=UPI001F050033|nr:hypothetical protein [Roseivivax marinus]UMA63642.1 hypothetical protein LVO79_11395 [Roseivivax marinus]